MTRLIIKASAAQLAKIRFCRRLLQILPIVVVMMLAVKIA